MIVKLFSLGVFACLWSSCTAYLVHYQAEDEWDYLVFSQKWPVTFCIHYTDYMTHPWRTCSLPENRLEWTIHGLWPNTINGMGPFFCNTSVLFDRTKLEMITSKLINFWPNLEGDKTVDSLWEHEWLKHGTCTLNFEPLNNEFKYFKGGLDLYGLYNMTSVMPSLDIFPDRSKGVSVDYIIKKIENVFHRTPYIECITMRDTGKVYLSEIRLCFDKGFHVIDCNHFHSVTNCPEYEEIIYPKDAKI